MLYFSNLYGFGNFVTARFITPLKVRLFYGLLIVYTYILQELLVFPSLTYENVQWLMKDNLVLTLYKL